LANLPTSTSVGITSKINANLITSFKSVAEEGGVMELLVWRVPRPVPPTQHGCIYRAVYAVEGVRVVGSTMNAKRAITAFCKGGRCPAHSPQLTPWWKTSWLPWMRPGQRHDKATHDHHHHEAGGVLRPLADVHIDTHVHHENVAA
jgi:hypothetical protein